MPRIAKKVATGRIASMADWNVTVRPASSLPSPGLLGSPACPDGPPGDNTIRVMTSVTAWTRRGFQRGLLGLLAGAFASPRPGRATAPTPAADWPVYRHDVALTGVSPGRGRIATPRVLWVHYLG